MAKHFQVDSGGSLNTSLVSYYKLEGDSTDYFGSNNGSDTNISYSNSGGKVNQYASFGGNSIIACGTSLLDTVTAGSISIWLYPTADGVHVGSNVWEFTTILSKNQIYIGMLQLDNNKVRLYYYDGTAQFLDSATALTKNAWNHIVFTWDSSGSVIYFNGSSDATSSTVTISNTHSGHLGQRFDFGNAVTASPSRYYSGRMDEIGIWTKKLSSTEVSDLYNGGSGQTMVDINDFPRTMSDASFNGASRTVTVTRIASFARTPADTLINAASRFAIVGKGVARTIADTMMNAAGRIASVAFIAHFVTHFSATISDSMMVARGRLTRVKAYVNGLLIQYTSKFVPQNTSYQSKYQRQNTVYEDKFQ